jgi:hypothetical protein
MTPEEWSKEQLKPLSMFEIAKWWADGLKVAGAGNGAGFLTAGAALTTFHGHYRGLLEVKVAGLCFLIGVLAFAYAYALIYRAMHAQDEVSQATMHKDVESINANSDLSGSSMNSANKFALVSAVSFFVGCLIGLIAFLSY